jgi:hypothetical protein
MWLDVVGPLDLDQRFPTLEAGGSNLGREDFANRPGSSPLTTATASTSTHWGLFFRA